MEGGKGEIDGVKRGDEVNGAAEVGGGGFEMIDGREIELLDAVPEGRKGGSKG